MSEGFEAKKHAYRQTQDGIVVSFVIHPNDVPESLALAALGTRFMIGFAEIGDDERPKPNRAAKGEDAADTASPRENEITKRAKIQALTDAKTAEDRAKPKRAFSDMSLSQQSGIRANDWRFQDFLEHEYPGVWRNLKDAAASIREICGVQSRSDLATDHNAANKWRVLNSKFETWLTDQLYAESIRR